MRAVVDRLQGLTPQPPGGVALSGRLRLGTGPARWGATLPDVAQPLAGIGGPQGDQFQTPDVTGQSIRVYTTNTLCVMTFFFNYYLRLSPTFALRCTFSLVVVKGETH